MWSRLVGGTPAQRGRRQAERLPYNAGGRGRGSPAPGNRRVGARGLQRQMRPARAHRARLQGREDDRWSLRLRSVRAPAPKRIRGRPALSKKMAEVDFSICILNRSAIGWSRCEGIRKGRWVDRGAAGKGAPKHGDRAPSLQRRGRAQVQGGSAAQKKVFFAKRSQFFGELMRVDLVARERLGVVGLAFFALGSFCKTNPFWGQRRPN